MGYILSSHWSGGMVRRSQNQLGQYPSLEIPPSIVFVCRREARKGDSLYRPVDTDITDEGKRYSRSALVRYNRVRQYLLLLFVASCQYKNARPRLRGHGRLVWRCPTRTPQRRTCWIQRVTRSLRSTDSSDVTCASASGVFNALDTSL